MSWTDEKVNKLKELWGKGQTASQIAEIIGGVSRNAVIGKAHRLNLSAKIKTRTSVSQNSPGGIASNNNWGGHMTEFDAKLLFCPDLADVDLRFRSQSTSSTIRWS